MKRRFIYLILSAMLINSMVLFGCSSQNATTSDNSAETQASNVNASAVTSDMITYEEDDYYSDWQNENPSYIKLEGSSASVSGTGATVQGKDITIAAAGVYVISGQIDNGQIIVNVQDKGTVKLVLNGAQITCSDSAPIYVMNAEKTIISLVDGTENTLSDGTNYTYADSEKEEPSATIFSKDNLTINGAGTLNVNANFNDGIVSKDELRITSGNINIKSKDDALIGKDMLLVKDVILTVEAGGDGLKATNEEKDLKGFIAIEGGKFNLIAGNDAIQVATSILVTDGEFDIKTGGGSENATVKSEENGPNGFNKMQSNQSTDTTETTETEKISSKAIKAAADLTISGGNFKIDSCDDALHSNNSINVAGGSFQIATGDDGIHADSQVTVSGGETNITKSYEGIESCVIIISGGKTQVVSTDDGINGSDGSSSSQTQGGPGAGGNQQMQGGPNAGGDQQTQDDSNAGGAQQMQGGPGGGAGSDVAEDVKVNINGGYLYINASGDGLDSNGSVYMTDGTVVVSGPTNDGNGPLDYNGEFEMTGGFLVAAGSSGMAQAPSEDSSQYSILMTYSEAQKADTLLNLQDSDGNSIATFAPVKQYSSVVITSPELKEGSTYTLYSGGSSTGTKAVDGLYTGGKYAGGTKVVDFTISSTVTYLNESGVTTANTGGMHGGMRGGMRGGQDGQSAPDGQTPPDGQAPPDGLNGQDAPGGTQDGQDNAQGDRNFKTRPQN
jgi:hypothetical protein